MANAPKTKITAPAPAPATPPANETLEQKVARLEAENAQQQEIIAGQSEQIQLAETSASVQLPVVTHEDQKYAVLAKEFTFEGVKIKDVELKSKPAVIQALVEAKSGILELITKPEAAE